MSNLTDLNQTLTNINCPSLGSGIAYGLLNVSGFLLNLMLIILILKHTNATLRPYTDVLLTSCAIDLYSSFFQFLTQARPTFQGSHHILTFSLDGLLPRLVQNWSIFSGGNLNYVLIPEYIGCYFSVCYCCVPFVYRYLMICWNHQMRRFEFFGLVFILLALTVFCSVTINYAASGAYETNMKVVPIPNPNCTRFVPQFSEGFNNGEQHLHKVFEMWSIGTMVILSTYLITLFCLIRIQVYFCCQHPTDSNATQSRIQRQISWTLALQAITPLLAFYGPQTAFQILLCFNISWMYAFELLFISYAAVPLLNSITVFILIASYRAAFFTLATNAAVRLSRYVSGSTTTLAQPLFENTKTETNAKAANNKQSVLVVDDF